MNASLERFEFEYGHRTCAALGSILDEVSKQASDRETDRMAQMLLWHFDCIVELDHQVHARLSTRDQSDTDLRRLASRVRTTLGLPSDDLLNWVWLYDELAAIRAEGKPLPPGLNDEPSLFSTIEDQARICHYQCV